MDRKYTQEEVARVCELYLEGKVYREIAEELDRPVPQISRLIQILRNYGADLPFRQSRIGLQQAAKAYLKKK